MGGECVPGGATGIGDGVVIVEETVRHVAVAPGAPTVTAVIKAYGTAEECQGVATALADNAHRACPQYTVDVRCVKRLDSDQAAAIAGHAVTGSVVRIPGVTYLLAAGAAGQATCHALVAQLRAAGNMNARCDEAPAAQ